ncbi:MAG: SDR family NAD(P)-dependent oxidoreductase [Alphaproteobacteria bacterium]
MKHPKTILITGASSGIGAALAKEYAAPGVTLGLTARNAVRLEAVAHECRERGAVVHTGIADVTDRVAIGAFIHHFIETHTLDLVIANAGISAGSFGGMEKEEQARAIFETNVDGVLNTIHAALPAMLARGTGQVAIMSSLAGIRALPSAPAYSASKAAVRFYGEAMRGLLKSRGVAVSVICPGYIRTPMTSRNPFFMPLIMSAERAARIIRRGLAQGKNRIAFPRVLYFALCLLASLPNFISNALFDALPAKPQIS